MSYSYTFCHPGLYTGLNSNVELCYVCSPGGGRGGGNCRLKCHLVVIAVVPLQGHQLILFSYLSYLTKGNLCYFFLQSYQHTEHLHWLTWYPAPYSLCIRITYFSRHTICLTFTAGPFLHEDKMIRTRCTKKNNLHKMH